ncbi:MAG: hemolysin family protein [Candidatus Omnitrophota bacterium]|nr:hemolysin family protein [Candidatus Omnitrophota bacterium]
MDIVVFIFLLIASAFFSSSETAFLSLGKIKLKQIERMDRPDAKRVVELLSDPNRLLVTILVGNTLVNIAASAVLADFCYGSFGEKGVPIAIVSMALIVLVFGEVTPKMFALANAQGVSFFAAVPLKLFEKIFAPARIVLSNISYSIVRTLGIKVSSESLKITEQDIRFLFAIGKKRGIVKEKEKEMIDGIFEFKELNAADIMTPRIDVAALDLTKKREEMVDEIKEHQYSRFPVYVHTLDNIVGVIHSKDFLLNPTNPIKDLVKKPYFAPESMKIDDLLRELQKRHIHMAVVTDEYGVTSGLVTIEDLLEEIVGEIRDELDFETPNIRKIDQKSFEIKGQTHVDEVNEVTGMKIETDEVDTIGGYVILRIGKIPQAGDTIEADNFLITVKDVSKNRITFLTIERKNKGKDTGS